MDDVTVDPKTVPFWTSCRFLLAVVGFLGCINVYAQRINMSVAMVCMLNNTALRLEADQLHDNVTINVTDSPYQEHACSQYSSNKTSDETEGEFAWDSATRSMILGSFFWGYLITQMPGGWLAERFGSKNLFGACLTVTTVSTLLVPVAARAHPYFLMALRVLCGLGEGVTFPCLHALWSKWAPPLERSRLMAFTYAGNQIGNVLTLPISGLLCRYGFDGGWPSIFYVFGCYGVVWLILWFTLVAETPATHPRISAVEKQYINQTVGSGRTTADERRKELGTPWLAILKSKAVWAIVVAHSCSNWGTYTLLIYIPTYMKQVLNFDIKSNGFFSAIPYILYWVGINLAGVIADWLSSRGWKTGHVRKIMQTSGKVIPSILLIALGYITCDSAYVAVGVLAVAVGSTGLQYGGFVVNHVDIAPPFAGILFGFGNTMATIPGIISPTVVEAITKDQTQGQWQIVFYLSAAIFMFGAIFFAIFGDGEVQDWVLPYMEDGSKEQVLMVTNTDTDKKPLDYNEDINTKI